MRHQKNFYKLIQTLINELEAIHVPLKRMGDEPDFEYVMIDSTIVRVHQHAAGKKGAMMKKA
jgi:hypothetical protein